MEGLKQCPKCQCTDVPMNAEICPFCGHPFERKSAARPVEKKKPGKPPETTDFILVTNKEPKKPEPKNGTEPVTVTDKVQNTENTVPVTGGNTAPSEHRNGQEGKKPRKRHGFRKLLIAVIVVYAIWSIFIKPSTEESRESQNRETANPYSDSYESTEPESPATDAGDEWMDESEESLEMDSEEMPTEEADDNPQFILPLSDQAYLTREDLEGLSAEELRIARNEIYARHGRMFKDEGLQAYFNSCDWYVGTIPADEFTDSVFNEYERANKDLIVSYEHELGVNGQ